MSWQTWLRAAVAGLSRRLRPRRPRAPFERLLARALDRDAGLTVDVRLFERALRGVNDDFKNLHQRRG